jgi:flagellar biosynthesis protein FlhB
VNTLAPLLAWILVVITFGIAIFFGRQQLQTLSWLRSRPELSDSDRQYFRRQSWRRLLGCVLLIAIGLLIAAFFVSGLDEWTTRMGEIIDEKGVEVARLDPEVQRMKNVFRWYIIVLMLLLLALVIVAGLDYWAIRKYGMRHLEQIKSDRRAMIEQELAELRKAKGNRNGRG